MTFLRSALFIFVAIAAAWLPAGTALAEKRIALVIGNAAYKHFGTLANPVQDVAGVAETLRAADFEVIEAVDQSHPELERTVRGFLGRLDGADVSLIYYSGHAVQVGGRNFVIPIDAKLESELDLDFEAIDLDTIMKFMAARTKMRLVFLDACRNNPFAGRPFSTAQVQTRSAATRGLARIDPGVGSLIAFSTEPGSVALDGKSGRHEPLHLRLRQACADAGGRYPPDADGGPQRGHRLDRWQAGAVGEFLPRLRLLLRAEAFRPDRRRHAPGFA